MNTEQTSKNIFMYYLVMLLFKTAMQQPSNNVLVRFHRCAKIAQIRRFFWSVFSRLNTGKYEPEKIPYSDTFVSGNISLVRPLIISSENFK